MKILIVLLFSLNLLAFEGQKVYECSPKYRIVGGDPHEFSADEQNAKRFQIIFNQSMTKLKSSDGMIYKVTSSNLKGKLYVNKKKVNGRMLNYKMKMASQNGMYRSVFVTGYGNLINEYVLCSELKRQKDN